jgi:predicted enzyme related to lactoylglutathione lyase
MDPVVHFEMPAEDAARITEFYSNVFGWKSKDLGPEMGNYTLVSTGESDPKTGHPAKPGFINGGFYKKTKDYQTPSIVIAVKDIRESMKKVQDAGGKLVGGMVKEGEPDEIPGVGLFMSFFDPEGNRLGMLQPNQM